MNLVAFGLGPLRARHPLRKSTHLTSCGRQSGVQLTFLVQIWYTRTSFFFFIPFSLQWAAAFTKSQFLIPILVRRIKRFSLSFKAAIYQLDYSADCYVTKKSS